MDFEKHRTLLFASNLEASQQMLGRCLVTDMDTVFGPAGTGVALPPGVGEDDEPSPAGVQITPTVGRFPHFGVWDGQPGMSRAIEAMIFPYLDKTHTMVTWKGQNFGRILDRVGKSSQSAREPQRQSRTRPRHRCLRSRGGVLPEKNQYQIPVHQ